MERPDVKHLTFCCYASNILVMPAMHVSGKPLSKRERQGCAVIIWAIPDTDGPGILSPWCSCFLPLSPSSESHLPENTTC